MPILMSGLPSGQCRASTGRSTRSARLYIGPSSRWTLSSKRAQNKREELVDGERVKDLHRKLAKKNSRVPHTDE
jgi:hypothetical protein